MKRIYLLLLLAVVFTANVFAVPRTFDLKMTHYIGQSKTSKHPVATGEKILYNADGTSMYWYTWGVINKAGMDSTIATDTIHIHSAWGQTYLGVFGTNNLHANDTAGFTPVDASSGQEKAVAFTPNSTITQSATSNVPWCDSAWITSVAANPSSEQTPSDNVLCTTVEITWWVAGVNTVNDELDGFIVFPNPASNNLNVKYDFKNNTKASIMLRDVIGKVVYAQDLGTVSGKWNSTIDISKLPAGMYYAELSINDQKVVSKISVK
jgi:hypothetical protein